MNVNVSSYITSVRGGRDRLSASVRSFVVSVRRSFLFLWVLEKGCVTLLLHFLGVSSTILHVGEHQIHHLTNKI